MLRIAKRGYNVGMGRKSLLSVLTTVLCFSACAFLSALTFSPYEKETWDIPESPIDKCVLSLLREKGLEPAPSCSDEVFVRRVYLDVTGTMPEPEDVLSFLGDSRPGKRAALISALLERDEFAQYWSLKWGDILRIKSEFPINLWPNAVQAYHRWVLESLRENKPYDIFARQLLTSSGSNFRVPQVNFQRAIQGRGPASLASAAALTFMGIRLEKMPGELAEGLIPFFSMVSYKATREWKEEIVYLNPAQSGPLRALFPDGKAVVIPPGRDPREVFADWLITPRNPWFSKNIVNRIWYWLMGRGIIHEPDDISKDNPPSNPELLALLERELVDSGYDMKHIYTIILNSRTYQQSSIKRNESPDSGRFFDHYPVRRLDAEVLLDMLYRIGGQREQYVSPIPEPFTVIPRYQRTILLSDGSITGPFLELFGRPPRDTGRELERNNQINDAQQRYLLNSSEIQKRIQSGQGVRKIISQARGRQDEVIKNIYLFMLSRYPTGDEIKAAREYFSSGGMKLYDSVNDLVWALINNKEFLYRH